MTLPPRVYACYSESHLPLVTRHFLPSVPTGFDLVLRRVPQSCPSGLYNRPGWKLTLTHKIDLVLKALTREQSTFVVSDVDVRFYDLDPGEIDVLVPAPAVVAYQLDVPLSDWQGHPKYCAGFAVMRPCQTLVTLYERTRTILDRINTEQEALYEALREAPPECATYLPTDRFWNLKHGAHGRRLAVDHANWITGIQNKIRHLDHTLRSRRP